MAWSLLIFKFSQVIGLLLVWSCMGSHANFFAWYSQVVVTNFSLFHSELWWHCLYIWVWLWSWCQDAGGSLHWGWRCVLLHWLSWQGRVLVCHHWDQDQDYILNMIVVLGGQGQVCGCDTVNITVVPNQPLGHEKHLLTYVVHVLWDSCILGVYSSQWVVWR